MPVRLSTRSERLLTALAPYPQVLVIMHDNPDPDAIASGWALRWLVEQRRNVPVRLLGGGDIVRAENRHMVKLLAPPIELVPQFEAPADAATILVDCDVSAENHLLSSSPGQAVAVVDHHEGPRRRGRVAFRDIRAGVAATATIAASYLREQGLQPEPNLATALVYAIRTETCGGEFFHSRLDRSIISWLTDFANPSQLAEIENAPLPRAYFADLALALQNTFTYDEVALCFLPSAQGAEIVGEVADLLSRCEQLRCVLCTAVVGNDLLLSVRTDNHDKNAAELVQDLVRGIGRGGGHQHRAGGKIPGVGNGEANIEELHDLLRSRWLAACNVDRQRGTRLVAKRDIIENL